MSRFHDMANEIRQRIQFEPLNILVWGPGNPGPSAPKKTIKAYEKRLEIKKVVAQKFPRAEVYFSEDPELETISDGIKGLLLKEALQSKVADLVLMLDIGRGVDLELDHFVPSYPWFREKVHVFLPERHVPPKGLMVEVFNYLKPEQVEGFSAKEFKNCDVATKKAVQAAESAALYAHLRR